MAPKDISADRLKALKELASCPGMPVFTLRHKDIEIVCPPEFVEKEYSDKLDAIEQKFYDEISDSDKLAKVVLPKIEVPNLDFALKLTKSDTFSLFNEDHLKMSGKLIELFMKAPTIDELLALGVFCRERLNAYLFIYTWTSALIHRTDTRHIRLPDITENLPGKFFPKSVLNDSRKIVYMSQLDRPVTKWKTENTVTNVSDELKMNYFREDIAINQHHFHWHIVYPHSGPPEVVNKDRRGELFYYMHNQTLRRLDNDRFCLGIPAVAPLKLGKNAKCAEGYFPKLDSSLGSRYLSGRPDNTEFSDVQLEGFTISAEMIRMWLERITNCITAGFVILPNRQRMELTAETGMDVIGNMIEASQLSPNRNYYGTVHNYGHTLISRCHDPTMNNNEEPGVMADTATAMRDPVFYQWHRMIDDVCREFKLTLPIYTRDEFACDGVKVDSVKVVKKGKETKRLKTFWEWDDVDCSRGLDFKSSNPIYVRFKHLNHDEWEFKVNATNSLPAPVKVSVRIWLVPVHDFCRRNIRLARTQNLAIEMDKFVATLQPGSNTIRRKSEESSSTLSFERAFPHRFSKEPPPMATHDTAYCSCGWPHHMYLPIGSADGTPFDVFVMLTPFDKDRTDSEDLGQATSMYCGMRNKKYPDKRAMGFPFDRLFDTKYAFLKDFVDDFPNIEWTRINIVHKNEERKGKHLMGEL